MTETATRPNVDYGHRSIYEDGLILRTVVGSGVHGIAIEGTDDHDEMAVYIEPPEMVLGIEAWSYTHKGFQHSEGVGMPNYVWRTQPEGVRSGPGDTDLVAYSLRKYLRLAMKGNPTVLVPLWAPESDVLTSTELGLRLRRMRSAFMSQRAAHRFLAYMESQHDRMLGGGKRNRVPNRPELVAKHGYDTKFAAHALRLAIQGHEVTAHGTLTLPMEPGHRDLVLSVKRGEHTVDEVSAWVGEYRTATRRLLDRGLTPLPVEPACDRINAFAIRAHVKSWDDRGW